MLEFVSFDTNSHMVLIFHSSHKLNITMFHKGILTCSSMVAKSTIVGHNLVENGSLTSDNYCTSVGIKTLSVISVKRSVTNCSPGWQDQLIAVISPNLVKFYLFIWIDITYTCIWI